MGSDPSRSPAGTPTGGVAAVSRRLEREPAGDRRAGGSTFGGTKLFPWDVRHEFAADDVEYHDRSGHLLADDHAPSGIVCGGADGRFGRARGPATFQRGNSSLSGSGMKWLRRRIEVLKTVFIARNHAERQGKLLPRRCKYHSGDLRAVCIQKATMTSPRQPWTDHKNSL